MIGYLLVICISLLKLSTCHPSFLNATGNTSKLVNKSDLVANRGLVAKKKPECITRNDCYRRTPYGEDVLPRTGRLADFWNEGIDQFLAYTQIDCMAGSPADRMVNTYAIRLRTIVRNGACGHLGAVSLMDECKFSIMDTLQRKCGHVIDSHGEPLIDYDGDVKSMCIVMKKAEDCVIPLMEKRCGYLSKLSYEYYTQMNLARFNLLFGLHGEGEPVARCSCFDNPNTNGLCEMPSEGCHHIISVNYERDMDPDARSDCMRYWRLLKASMMEDFITTTSTTTTTTTTTIPTTITTTTQTTSYENTTTMTTNMPVIEHRNMGHK